MKHFVRLYSFSLLLSLSILLSACGQADLPHEDENTPVMSYSYTQVTVSFDDPGGRIIQDKYGWETEQNGFIFQFTGKVLQEERDAVVSRILQMVDLIEKQFNITPATRIICIRDISHPSGIYNGILYAGIPELGTQDFAACFVQYIFGVKVNYGLCYAFGAELRQAMGFNAEKLSVSVEDALELCESAPMYLDLNYACFLSDYADEGTLSRVKLLALDFYRSLTQGERIELFYDYSHALYRKKFKE